MKTYMPLNGLRWSRNSGSANCDMPQSAVFGRPGGGGDTSDRNISNYCICKWFSVHEQQNRIRISHLLQHEVYHKQYC